MKGEIITVGTELLMGGILNTNVRYLSEQLIGAGVPVLYQVTVGDREEQIMEALRLALEHADLVVMTGGLGPTADDVTKESAAKLLNLQLVEDAHTRERLNESLHKSIGRKVTSNNWKQAVVISGAKILDNESGTAPGEIIALPEGKKLILLPGPPEEMKQIFRDGVKPALNAEENVSFLTRVVKIAGISESMVATKLGDLTEEGANPNIATYARIGQVDVRITARAANAEEAEKLLKPVMKKIRVRFGNAIFTNNEEDTLESVVVELLKKRGKKIATAESCTGGLLAGRIVNVPGASQVFEEGIVSYSNKAKQKTLGVKKGTLKEEGAVSEKTAAEMAKGICRETKAQVGVSVTGIAGPDGGSKKKPVGLVFIGCCIDGRVTVEEYRFDGTRDKVRERSVKAALDLVRRSLQTEDKA